MRLTENNEHFIVTIPSVTFTGDFRVSYRREGSGITIGTHDFRDYITRGLGTVKLANSTYNLTVHNPPLGERDGLSYANRVWIERKGSVLTIYDGESRENIIQQETGVTTGTVEFRYLGQRANTLESTGISWDVLFEDLEDTGSTNNRLYKMNETHDCMTCIDSISLKHGTYSALRSETRTLDYTPVNNGWRHPSGGFIKDTRRYDKSKAKVFATFSASILKAVLQYNRVRDLEWKFLQHGVEVEVFQYGQGGEDTEEAILDFPAYITNLLDKGYALENITVLIHMGGNDVSGSTTYAANKDTNEYILQMRPRFEELYSLFTDAGLNVIWLPISWRNYGSVPPDSGGSEPYNTNIVHPFLSEVVGDSSWDSVNEVPKYDFYGFTKAAFAENNDFLSDSVHPSEYGGEVTRQQFADWFKDLYTVTVDSFSTLNINITGIADGDHHIKLHGFGGNLDVFSGVLSFVDGSASLELPLPVGTVVSGIYEGDNPPITGTGFYGVTE